MKENTKEESGKQDMSFVGLTFKNDRIIGYADTKGTQFKDVQPEYDKYPYGKPQTDEVARGSGNREYGCRRLREKLPNFSGVSFF